MSADIDNLNRFDVFVFLALMTKSSLCIWRRLKLKRWSMSTIGRLDVKLSMT